MPTMRRAWPNLVEFTIFILTFKAFMLTRLHKSNESASWAFRFAATLRPGHAVANTVTQNATEKKLKAKEKWEKQRLTHIRGRALRICNRPRRHEHSNCTSLASRFVVAQDVRQRNATRERRAKWQTGADFACDSRLSLAGDETCRFLNLSFEADIDGLPIEEFWSQIRMKSLPDLNLCPCACQRRWTAQRFIH